MDAEQLYKNLLTISNGSIIAFNAITLDILKDVKVNDKEISVLRNKMSKILWEWQTEKEIYLKLKAPATKNECKMLYSYKIYQLVDRIFNRCVINNEEGVENTICAVLYDVCLFSSWFLASIERYYLGNFPNVFNSDIFDVNLEFLKDIITKAAKRSDEYYSKITAVIEYLQQNHPMIIEKPLGGIITKQEIDNYVKQRTN